jgi:RHS repeat-associated protein
MAKLPRQMAHSTGKERDSESGNDFGARYHSSTMGRFLSPDWSSSPDAVPYTNLNNPQSLNLYSYGGNNPLGHTDPDGHCEVEGQQHGFLWCVGHALGFIETAQETQTRLLGEANGYLKANNVALIRVNGHWQQPGGSSNDDIVAWWQQYNQANQDDINQGGRGLAFAGSVPGIARMRLLSEAQDPKLRNIIDNLYRDTSSFGDGGTADAIIYEHATGQPVGGTFHSQKGIEAANGLRNLVNSGQLNSQDEAIATTLYNQLKQALNSTGR